MVSCSIPLNDRGVPPIWILLVQLVHQVLHEKGHHAFVGVGLGQAQVDVGQLVDSGDHGNSWCHCFGLHGIVALRFPMESTEVSHVYPRFIYVDHVNGFMIQLQKLHSPPLSQHKTFIRVSLP